MRPFREIKLERWMAIPFMSAVIMFTSCSSGISLEKIAQIKPAMKVQEVEAILGRPDRIDQSETMGLRGQVFYYHGRGGEGQIVLLNDTVFQAEFVPEGKST